MTRAVVVRQATFDVDVGIRLVKDLEEFMVKYGCGSQNTSVMICGYAPNALAIATHCWYQSTVKMVSYASARNATVA